MSDLGDIGGFLKEGNVANLEWLKVDEEAYRTLDRLPQYNYETIPDLEAAWSHGGPRYKDVVPNQGPLNAQYTPDRMQVEIEKGDLERLATTMMMAYQNTGRVVKELQAKVGSEAVRKIATHIKFLHEERGLIGGYYVRASDLPTCDTTHPKTAAYVKKYAKNARYLVACGSCTECACNASRGEALGKKIVTEVPYSDRLADTVELRQAALGRKVEASAESPKVRIQRALLAQVSASEAIKAPVQKDDPSRHLAAVETKKVHLPVVASAEQRALREAMEWNPSAPEGKVASAQTNRALVASRVVETLKRELIRGSSEARILGVLKSAFTKDELQGTKAHWENLFKEAGLYGRVWLPQTAFDSCEVGSSTVAKYGSDLQAIIASDKCSTCVYRKGSHCDVYKTKLASSVEEVYTSETLRAVAGHGFKQASDQSDIRGAIKSLYRQAHQTETKSLQAPNFVRHTVNASSSGAPSTELTKRSVLKTAKSLQESGLYGRTLLAALRTKFIEADLKTAGTDLVTVLRAQPGKKSHVQQVVKAASVSAPVSTDISDFGLRAATDIELNSAEATPSLAMDMDGHFSTPEFDKLT